MIITSNKVDVNASQEIVQSFLTDSNNLIHLLPQDKITDFKSTSTECSFKVQGGVTISLIQNGIEGNDKVLMKSGEKSPFPFKLTVFINKNENTSNGHIEFDGEVNMFLKMMVEKPLTALFNHMAEKLQEFYKL
jgi:carbon monoxide dehydrogenase subunit G